MWCHQAQSTAVENLPKHLGIFYFLKINFRYIPFNKHPTHCFYSCNQPEKEKFTINELQERLRQNNIFNLGDVEYAILETSGEISVIQKPEKRNTIPEDFGILPEYEGIPYDLVIDGKVMHENLKAIGKDYNWLLKQTKAFKIRPEEALVVTFDGKGQIFCQEKERKK